MTTNNVHAFPGMLDQSTEFFIYQDKLKVIQNGNIKDLSELPLQTVELLKNEIKANRVVNLALHDLHPTSKFKRIEQFITCRFGGLDHQPDVIEGKLQDGEYWPCPKRGSCPHEGVLCKLPIVKDERLTKQDVELLQQLSTEKTNEVIAAEMHLAPGTFHQVKKYLYRKIGNVQTKQASTQIAQFFNLI